MANLNESLRNMNFESAAARGSTDVTVSAFGNNALKGILEAISRQSSIITSLEDEVESLRETQSKQNNDNRKEDRKNNLASDAANRKSRATNAAMYGEIKKGNVFNKMLREGLMSALEGLTGFLKENLNKALKTQSDLATIMRKANLTHDQKNQIQDIAISMKGILEQDFKKLNISNAQAKEYISDLIASGKDVTRMSKEELAGYMALRRRNMDADKAYELAKVSSYDSMKNLANSLGDNQVTKSLGNVISSLSANQRATLGGTDKAIETLTPLVKQLEERAGGVLNSEEVSQIVMAYAARQNPALAANGSLPKEVEALWAAGGKAESIDKFFDNIAATSNLVTSAGDVLPNFAARAKEAEENGHNIRKELYTDKQIEEANETNTAEGKLPNLFEDVFNSTLGKITGPLANTLDEWFGEGVDITKIVGTGFKIVIGLLGSIVTSKIIGNPGSLLSGLFGKGGGLLNAIKGLGPSIGRVAAQVVTKIPVIAAGTAAAASIYMAYSSITDAADRLERVEKADESLKKAKEEKRYYEDMLAAAKAAGDTKDIATYTAKLATAEKNIQTAQNEQQDAYNKRTKALEISNEFENKLRNENNSLMSQRDEVRKQQRRAMEAGDKELAERLKKKGDELNQQIVDNNERIRKVSTEAQGFLTTGLASALNAFGIEFSPEAMEGWYDFKEGVANFFKETIPNALSSAGKYIKTKWNNLTSTIGDFITKTIPETFNNLIGAVSTKFEEIKTNIFEFFSPIKESFNEIIGKVSEFFSPIKDFFNFDWLPGPVKKFIFDKDYGASDLASDLASGAVDKGKQLLGGVVDTGKQLLNGAANIVSDGVNFVKGIFGFANGGVVNQATPAVVGEDGKEAILPLTKPEQLLAVMNKLTSSEHNEILKSILSSKNFSIENLSSILLKYVNTQLSTTSNKNNIVANTNSIPATGDVPGDDPATIRKILSFAGPFSGFVYNLLLHGKNGKYKNAFEQRKKWYAEALQNAAIQDGRDLIRGTYAERALDWGVTQLGKPYILRSLGKIGYVCNELTDAALRASGFDMKDFHIYGVSATFDKLKSGKRSKLKRGDRKGELEEFPDFRIRDDLTIDTATPGMLFFQVAKGKSNPGHIGLVYYGHQKLHSSGGSANYTKGGFLTNWQTPCRGVTVTPPKPGEQYIIGELPGLFAQANGEFKLPEGANFGPGYNTDASTSGSSNLAALVDESIFTNSASLHDFISQFIGTDYQNLQSSSMYSELVADYESAIADIAASSSLEAKRNAIEFSKSALSLLGNKRTSPEVLEALSTMIKYLRDIALSPANKKAITPVSRPVNASFA